MYWGLKIIRRTTHSSFELFDTQNNLDNFQIIRNEINTCARFEPIISNTSFEPSIWDTIISCVLYKFHKYMQNTGEWLVLRYGFNWTPNASTRKQNSSCIFCQLVMASNRIKNEQPAAMDRMLMICIFHWLDCRALATQQFANCNHDVFKYGEILDLETCYRNWTKTI